MAVSIREETLSIECEVAEPILDSDLPSPLCYPLPRLNRTGHCALRELATVTIENDYIRAVVCVDLGGRIIELFDKRAESAAIELPKTLELADCDFRGVRVAHGIEFLCGETPRRLALAPIAYQILEGSDSLLMAELVVGTGLSFHVSLALRPDEAALRIAYRSLNRGFAFESMKSGLAIHWPGAETVKCATGCGLVQSGQGVGIGVAASHSTFDALHPTGPGFELVRAECDSLGPRWTDSWELSLFPFSGTDGLLGIGEIGAVSAIEARLTLQATKPWEGNCKLQMEAQTFEAKGTGSCDKPWAGRLPDDAGELKRLAIVSQTGEVLVDSLQLANRKLPASPDPDTTVLDRAAAGNAEEGDYELLRRDPRLAPAGYVLEGYRALEDGRFDNARASFENALGRSGEDHLSWWMLSLSKRLAGDENSESELQTAHYLAPLEPGLRVEALLSQPHSPHPGPNPLVRSVASDPNAALDVLCQLIDAGLDEQAARWGDEVLRHGEIPLVRLLLAWSLIGRGTMEAEAAAWVAQATGVPLPPPWPWRRAEMTALRGLAIRFPQNVVLKLAIEAPTSG